MALLDQLTEEFKRLQQEKSRAPEGVELRMLTNLAFVLGEHWVRPGRGTLPILQIPPHDPDRLYLVFPLIAARLSTLLGRLTAGRPIFRAVPDKRDPKAYAQADVVDRLLLALDQKLDEPTRDWERKWWMAVTGVAFEYVRWVPDATIEPMPETDPVTGEVLFVHAMTGEKMPERQAQALVAQGMAPEHFEVSQVARPVGDVGTEILGPLNVFLPSTIRAIEDLAPDQAVYLAKLRTLGWVEQMFPIDERTRRALEEVRRFEIVRTQVQTLGPTSTSSSLRDLLPLVQGERDPKDPPVALVVERFQPASQRHPQGRYVVFVPDIAILHDGPLPTPDGSIPLVDFHWGPVTTTFWTPGYVERLIAAQKFLNRRLSQLGEQANATLYDSLLLGPGLKRDDIPADKPTAIENALSADGQPLIQRMGAPNLPPWFLESINLTLRLFNDLAGGTDLLQETRFPGQLRGPLAVPLLQELLDSEWGPVLTHYAQRLARVKQLRLAFVKAYYPPVRTMHYTTRDQRDEVFEFHTQQILKTGTNYEITLEPSSIMPELRSMREARVIARLQSPLAVLYVNRRTGTIDPSKIAADLQYGDLGREGREATYRKLGAELVARLWRGEPLPPPLPFWNHQVIMDELELAMASTEFLSASPPTQQAFFDYWQQCRQLLVQQAQAVQSAAEQQQIRAAVAQATQQAAAKAAAETVEVALDQARASQEVGQRLTPDLVRALAQRLR